MAVIPFKKKHVRLLADRILEEEPRQQTGAASLIH
jgi:hypothetical protein